MPKSALVLGGNGLIGRHLVDFLLKDDAWSRVITVLRRSGEDPNSKVEEVIADAHTIVGVSDRLAADTVFCCLGTTQRKAGGREGLRFIDHDYVLKCAEIALENGASRFLLVSSVGAKVGSPSFYAHVKGETERDVAALGFETLDILRPSLLLGQRSEQRLAEDWGGRFLPMLNPMMVGRLRKFRPIQAEQVAGAMASIARQEHRGVTVYTSDELADYSVHET